MKITKLVHSTLLIEIQDKRILLDPGDYTFEQVKDLQNIDLILITHTHSDHLHLDSIRALLENNPGVEVIANTEVSKALEGICQVTICEGRQRMMWHGIAIEAFDNPHVEIWKDVPLPQNTGYMIDDYFYTPADGWGVIDKPVEVLAFMITGPATPIREALAYAIDQKPKHAFGVHDGMLNRTMANHKLPEKFLPDYGIQYKNLELGKAYDY